MKVITMINGSVSSESMAFYAIKYAQAQDIDLVLLHISNKKDNIESVDSSVERIKKLAISEGVNSEYVVLKGSRKKAIRDYTSTNHIDIIFCSTRKHKSLITNSFSETLINIKLNVDVAVVRIVNMSSVMDISSMMLSIKKDKLSVKKFTFFTTLASAYKVDGEIYSVSSMSRLELSQVDMHKAREKLRFINYNLRHYIKLSKFMPFSIHIKHDFTNNEAKSILTHIVKSNAKLVVVGGKRLSVTSFFKPEMPIEKLMREASVNMIAYYSSED